MYDHDAPVGGEPTSNVVSATPASAAYTPPTARVSHTAKTTSLRAAIAPDVSHLIQQRRRSSTGPQAVRDAPTQPRQQQQQKQLVRRSSPALAARTAKPDSGARASAVGRQQHGVRLPAKGRQGCSLPDADSTGGTALEPRAACPALVAGTLADDDTCGIDEISGGAAADSGASRVSPVNPDVSSIELYRDLCRQAHSTTRLW